MKPMNRVQYLVYRKIARYLNNKLERFSSDPILKIFENFKNSHFHASENARQSVWQEIAPFEHEGTRLKTNPRV